MDRRMVFGGVFTGLPVLITGHTGFKGSWLSIWLNELGSRVIGYSGGSTHPPRNFQLCQLEKRITHIVGDVRDLNRLRWTIETYKPKLVIHLAAQALVRVSYDEPKTTFDTNVGGTVNVLEAIRQTDSVKAFLGITTDKVYRQPGVARGFRESDPLGGDDPYSASKAAVEVVVESYRRSCAGLNFGSGSLGIATARGGNVIGGGDFAKFRLVPDCMRGLMESTTIKVRNPDAIRPWLHVLDLLSGYLWLAANLLKQPEEFSEAWNFGPAEDETVTCEMIVKAAIALWKEKGGSYQLDEQLTQAYETPMLKLNWEKAANRLAWRPICSWKDALGATVIWFREYERQLRGGAGINVYDYCVGQIDEYVNSALGLGIIWTHP